MKPIFTLIVLLLMVFPKGQNILELYPHPHNNAGWEISGNGIYMETNPYYDGGFNRHLNIYNSSQNTEDFILKSPTFSLFPNQMYQLQFMYYHGFFDAMQGFQYYDLLSSVVLKDSGGNVIRQINLNNFTGGMHGNNWSDYFFVDATGSYYFEFSGRIDHSAFPQSYIVCGFGDLFLTKSSDKYTFSGTVQYDADNNGCTSGATKVNNFPIFKNHQFVNVSKRSNNVGNYLFSFSQQGLHTLSLEANPNIEITPPQHLHDFQQNTETLSNRNFCLKSLLSSEDVAVSIVPLQSESRPGFRNDYKITYTNYGNAPATGTVQITYDNTKTQYQYADTSPVSTTGNTITWDYANLQPFETREIIVTFLNFPPPTVNSGDIIVFSSSISATTDANLSNNSTSLSVTLVNAYDPNDVTVLEGEEITLEQTSDDLHYRIRFQNTGDASAVNIVVNTKLDPKLDWNTLEYIDASHSNYYAVANGNDINFYFDEIYLADSTSNEPASHGWILYKIKPKSTVVLGDVISNYADIYFDYNEAITTNTATVTVTQTLSTKENTLSKLSLYPNPVQNILYTNQNANFTYQLFDMGGRQIKHGVFTNSELDISYLEKGIYLIKITNDKGESIIKKLIKK